MASGGGKHGEGMEKLETTEADPEQGGGRQESVGELFFNSVVQQVLLFGSETWVVTPRMERALISFIHGAAIRITGRQPRRGRDGKWFYPSLEGAMKESGFQEIRTSINNRQNTVVKYIATQTLLDLCKGTKQIEGARVALRWWDQKGIDWEKAKAGGEETESESETDTEEEETRSAASGGSSSSGAEWSGESVDQWEVKQTSNILHKDRA